MTEPIVKRVGEWLVVSDGTVSRSYPWTTTADDLEAWADAQVPRINELMALRDLLRAAATKKRTQSK